MASTSPKAAHRSKLADEGSMNFLTHRNFRTASDGFVPLSRLWAVLVEQALLGRPLTSDLALVQGGSQPTSQVSCASSPSLTPYAAYRGFEDVPA